jgi:acetolactate decarboxylase
MSRFFAFLFYTLYLSAFYFSQQVQTVSAMKPVMMGQDLSNHLYWDTLNKENLYAIAPLGRIEGEVTVLNGAFYVSRVNAQGQEGVTNSSEIHSPFAVFAYVRNWKAIEWKGAITSEEHLQQVIEQVAKENGVDTEQAFPFRVITGFKQMNYHIISKPADEESHNHELHNKAKKHFVARKVQGELLGFFSKTHEGVFTHRGHWIHTHFVSESKQQTGHVEDFRTKGKVIILLPAH